MILHCTSQTPSPCPTNIHPVHTLGDLRCRATCHLHTPRHRTQPRPQSAQQSQPPLCAQEPQTLLCLCSGNPHAARTLSHLRGRHARQHVHHAKGRGHGRDEHREHGLQVAHAQALDEQQRERVHRRHQHARPQRHRAVRQQRQRDRAADHLRAVRSVTAISTFIHVLGMLLVDPRSLALWDMPDGTCACKRPLFNHTESCLRKITMYTRPCILVAGLQSPFSQGRSRRACLLNVGPDDSYLRHDPQRVPWHRRVLPPAAAPAGTLTYNFPRQGRKHALLHAYHRLWCRVSGC